MPQLCESLISAAIQFDCEEISVRGMEADGVIINRDDIDFAACVIDDKNGNIIKTLALKSGKTGYAVAQLGNTPFTGLVSNLNVGTYRNTWTHEIPIAVLANDPTVARDIIDPLSNGNFVLVLRNKNKGENGEGEFQIFGYHQGCRASAGTNEKYSEDTEGGWLITLQEQNAPKAGMFLWNTDAATTRSQYDSLTS